MGFILSIIFGIAFFPITILGSWVVVHPQEEKIILFWGKLKEVIGFGLVMLLRSGMAIYHVVVRREIFIALFKYQC